MTEYLSMDSNKKIYSEWRTATTPKKIVTAHNPFLAHDNRPDIRPPNFSERACSDWMQYKTTILLYSEGKKILLIPFCREGVG